MGLSFQPREPVTPHPLDVGNLNRSAWPLRFPVSSLPCVRLCLGIDLLPCSPLLVCLVRVGGQVLKEGWEAEVLEAIRGMFREEETCRERGGRLAPRFQS